MIEISIHALHEESDLLTPPILPDVTIFQSTLSMRRATRLANVWGMDAVISIHALHEESDRHQWPYSTRQTISIHALHEESDFL